MNHSDRNLFDESQSKQSSQEIKAKKISRRMLMSSLGAGGLLLASGGMLSNSLFQKKEVNGMPLMDPGIFNVLDYGATGNGTSDDQPGIQWVTLKTMTDPEGKKDISTIELDEAVETMAVHYFKKKIKGRKHTRAPILCGSRKLKFMNESRRAG